MTGSRASATTADVILSFDPTRRTNDVAVAELARLGFCPEPVFDVTYGRGVFWKLHRPTVLATNDLRVPGTDYALSYCQPFPAELLGRWSTVVYDPVYKLNGNPTDDDRYGADERVSVAERMRRIELGAVNSAELVAPDGFLWIKYQDQVSCGRMNWQGDLVRDALPGWTREARLLVAGSNRPQRSQVRPRCNFSTLEVWRRANRPGSTRRQGRIVSP